jgi:hypothetical protein
MKHHTMMTYGGMEIQFHMFLTSLLDGGEWLASCPGLFTLEKQTLVPTGYEAGLAPEPVWTW